MQNTMSNVGVGVRFLSIDKKNEVWVNCMTKNAKYTKRKELNQH